MQLDEYQKQAVETEYDRVLVAAASGSGKTRVMTERINWLLSHGYEPNNIYAITFTNAAAEEMRSRIDGNANIFVGTIHSLANRILLQNGIDTGWIIQSENFDMLFEKFQEIDNLILPVVDYLLVDEFQDICENDYKFMFDILKPKQFMVCGDSAQSIYSFRGSNFEFFMNMIDDPSIKVYELPNNYRCAQSIIEFAENFIAPLDDIYQIFSIPFRNEWGYVNQETFSIDNLIEEIENENLKDIFILTRTNKEVGDIINILNNNNIPCDTFKKSDFDSINELKNIMDRESIKVLTIHSSKGLENKKVIVLGGKCWNNEERRICYVAATRAKDELVWMKAKPKKKKPTKMVNWG